MYYAGIGSRGIPFDAKVLIRAVACEMAKADWVLRSGAAPGADKAFEDGCNDGRGEREIYLPWKGFENHTSDFHPPTRAAYEVASKYHPNWDTLKDTVKPLMARNSHQVLGWSIGSSPAVDIVICYTDDGSEGKTTTNTGGTGQAIRIAHDLNIPIINLKNPDAIERLSPYLPDNNIQRIKDEMSALASNSYDSSYHEEEEQIYRINVLE